MARINQRLGLTRYEADEYYKKALAAYEKRNFEEAFANIDEAINTLPTNSEYYAARGFFYVEDDVPDKAEADFDKALKIHPYELLAHYGRGIIAFRSKKWDEAQQHFLNAYYANPKRAETLYYLAIVYHRRGENANAVHVMRQAHDLLEAAGDKRRSDALKWIRTLEKIPDAPRLESGTG